MNWSISNSTIRIALFCKVSAAKHEMLVDHESKSMVYGMLEDMSTVSTRGPVMTRVSCPVSAPPRVTRHVYQRVYCLDQSNS